MIEHDYQSNVTATNSEWFYLNTDHTTRSGGGGVFNSLEWKSCRSWQIPGVVYVKGNNMSIVLRWTNPGFSALSVTLTINGVRLSVPPKGGSGSTTYETLSGGGPYTFSIPAEDEATKTVTFSGLPSYVTRGTLQVNATATANGTTVWSTLGAYQNWEKVYVADATPAGKQTQPWTDLLDYGCDWALGETGQDNVTEAITLGMFDSAMWTYDGTTARMWKSGDDYDLTKALTYTGFANCDDTAGFLALCIMSVGYANSQYRWQSGIYDEFDRELLYRTNDLCPMGSSRANSGNYHGWRFAYHHVVYVGGNVYDSALSHLVDLAGNSYLAPAMKWAPAGWWQTDDSESFFFGLCAGYYPNYTDTANWTRGSVPGNSFAKNIQSIS